MHVTNKQTDRENEEELNEHGTKWQNSSHQCSAHT